MSLNLDPAFLAQILGTSVSLCMLWRVRTPILNFVFRTSDVIVESVVLQELIRVENKKEYKLIPKTFLKGKSGEILKLLN
jgi:hypothetical protein